MRHFLSFLLLAGFAAAALAQLRSIPADAKRATLRHVQGMMVELDGKPAMLSVGAQIRDTSNRIVVPSAVATTTVVRYLPDQSGQQIHRVWVLSPEEAAQSAPKPVPKPPPPPEPKKADDKKGGS